jgi:hypothetical protein
VLDLIVAVAARIGIQRRGTTACSRNALLFAGVRTCASAGHSLPERRRCSFNDFSQWTTLQLLPETRQVFPVTGTGPIGRFWTCNLQK